EPQGCKAAVKLWDNGKGYNLEASIPLKAMEYTAPAAGGKWLWEWDLIYGAGDKAGLKLFWTPELHGANYQSRSNWDRAVFVESDPAPVLGISRIPAASLPDIPEKAWSAGPSQTIRVDENKDAHMCRFEGLTDGKNLYLRFRINDPDPALNTATIPWWWDAGDGVDLFVKLDGGREIRRIHLAGATWGKEAYTIRNYATTVVSGSLIRSTVNADKRGYVLLATLPVSALGGEEALKKGVEANFRINWSDRTGGSVFAKVFWCGRDQIDTNITAFGVIKETAR
ncbi:MAG: hypothetical protein PHT33_13780, partial [bacterium]|nr:hypothetical protein [bacterium]